MADIKKSVLSGLKWSSGAKFSTQLINWSITIIVMRLLQPDDYGLLAMAMVFVTLCFMLNEMGMGAALVQSRELTDKLLRQAFGLVLLLNGTIAVLLLAVSPLIAAFYEEPRLTEMVPALAIQFPIMAFSVIPSAILTREMNFRSLSIVGIVAELSSGIATLFFAWIGFAVWSLVIGAIIRVTVNCVGMNIANPYFRRPSFNFKGFAKAAKYGGYISLHRMLWYLYSQADVLIIGKMLGKTSLGYYSIAMHIASLPMQKVGAILSQVGLPAYSKLQDNPEQVAHYALKVTRAIGLVSIPIFLGISGVAPELISVVLGEKWLLAILPIQLLALIVPLRILSISLAPAINGMGRPDVNVKTLAVACVVMPVAFLIGVQWGLKGVSLAWVIGYTLWFNYMLSQVLPVIGLTMARFFRVLRCPAFFGAVMYGIIYLVNIALNKWQVNDAISLAILVFAGAIVYAVCILLFCRADFTEVWAMIRQRSSNE